MENDWISLRVCVIAGIVQETLQSSQFPFHGINAALFLLL